MKKLFKVLPLLLAVLLLFTACNNTVNVEPKEATSKTVTKQSESKTEESKTEAKESESKTEAEATTVESTEAETTEDEESKKAAEEESKKAAEEESKKAAEEESKKAAEEESKKAAEEESKKAAEEESKKAAEEESKKAAEEESKKVAEEESKKAAEEESKKAAEEESKKAAEEESKKAAEEESKKAAEEESKKAAEEESKKAAEEESKKAAEEESKKAAEEESKKVAEEESKKADDEAQKVAAGEGEKEVEKLPEIHVGLCTDVGGVDDKSFNQGTWEGVLRYMKEQGLDEEYYQFVQATSDADYLPQLTTFAEAELDLIIAPGFLFTEAMTQVANDYPDQNFLLIDAVADAPNVASATFSEHEGSFLVGVAAALKAEAEGKDKVGFIGGMDFETIQKFEAGYEQGVHAVNPDMEVVIEYVGAFDRPEDAQAIATKMYDSGVYVIYHAAGGSGNGVIKEAKDRALNGEQVWVIGVDRDQYEEGIYEDGKSVILTSMVKQVDVAAYTVSQAVARGEFKGGILNFALKDGGVDIPEENPNLEEEWIKKIAEFKEQIISEELEVKPMPARLEGKEEK